MSIGGVETLLLFCCIAGLCGYFFCGENVLIRYSSSGSGKIQQQALLFTAAEHGIKRELVDQNALDIIKRLDSWGFKAYIVGGAVRDLLIGRVPKDFDIVTDAVPTKIKKIFRNSRIIGKRFRLVHIFFGSMIYEVATFRSTIDGSVGNTYGTIDEDVRRRDFSLNALYYDPLHEIVIDYVHGIDDIHKRLIKPVIPLKNIFVEDPVRMLRAVKYAAQSDFRIPFRLSRRIKKQNALLQPVSPSRLTEELVKILNSGNAYAIIKKLNEYDLFMYMQPSVVSLMDSSTLFADDFMDSLTKLDDYVATNDNVRLGKKLSFVLDPFITLLLADSARSGLDAGALYTYVYNECRHFVLPMNPPRVELDFAVRTCMRRCGIVSRPPRQKNNRCNSSHSASQLGKTVPVVCQDDAIGQNRSKSVQAM